MAQPTSEDPPQSTKRKNAADQRSAVMETELRRRLKVNVRSCRKGAGLTLKVVSERAEMHWRHWQKIEAGEVNATLQTLVRVADALRLDPVDLIRNPPPEKAKS